MRSFSKFSLYTSKIALDLLPGMSVSPIFFVLILLPFVFECTCNSRIIIAITIVAMTIPIKNTYIKRLYLFNYFKFILNTLLIKKKSIYTNARIAN